MPRKQNGWGSQGKGFNFPKGASFSKSLKPGAWGGLSVQTVGMAQVSLGVSLRNTIWTVTGRSGVRDTSITSKLLGMSLSYLNPNFQQEEQPGIDTVNQYIPAQLESVLYQGTGSELETVFLWMGIPNCKR